MSKNKTTCYFAKNVNGNKKLMLKLKKINNAALSNALSITYLISQLLQGKDDVSTASKYSNDIISTLVKHKKGCEESFKNIFKECKIIFNKLT